MSLDMSKKGVILLVEDEPELRELLAEYLREEGFTALLASNGQEAISIIRNQSVDAIVSDLRMPVKDGLSFLLDLRALGRETPFIVLTAYADKASIVTALRLGATDFIEKPIDATIFVNRVASAAALGRKIRELDLELDQICSNPAFTIENREKFREAQKSLLLMKMQRVAK